MNHKSQLQIIEDNGWMSARFGQGIVYCPYRYGTAERAAWLAGWESYHFGR